MTNKNSDKYEEAEIVSPSNTSRTSGSAQSQAGYRARTQTQEMHKDMLLRSLGALFAVLFGFFVVVALIITVLFWLLPFAAAALIVTIMIALTVAAYQGVRNLFRK